MTGANTNEGPGTHRVLIPVGQATVRAPGVCGELVQGMLDDVYFLVTCPIDFFSRVKVELFQGEPGVDAPDECPKAAKATQAALAYLGSDAVGARLTISNPIPRSKGMGSSSADVIGVIVATALALGRELSPTEVAPLALSVEPTDGVMFPGIVLFDHREGRLTEQLGVPPPIEVIALDFGGTVDTLEFNAVDRRASWQSIQPETDEALRLVRLGMEQSDPKLIGQGASISARAGQRILEKAQLAAVMEFAESVGAVGVNVAHSGTVIGILVDAMERRGRSIFRQAREAFPDAEAAHHFRIFGGGMQVVGTQP